MKSDPDPFRLVATDVERALGIIAAMCLLIGGLMIGLAIKALRRFSGQNSEN